MYQRFVPEGWSNLKETYSISDLKIAKDKKEILQGKINSFDDMNNAHISLGDNIQGIIPKEELGTFINTDKFVQFKVKLVDEKENKCILSRKLVKDESLKWFLDNLAVGDVVDGIVRNIKPYGAFVEIGGGSSGLIYINDISVARMKSPKEKLKIGQKIQVKVKDIDKVNKKFYLSYKELLGTWEDNIKDLYEGQVINGIAKEVTQNKDGIFIELKPNLVGMCEYNKNISYGQTVKVKIKRIIPNKKKIKLSIVSC